MSVPAFVTDAFRHLPADARRARETALQELGQRGLPTTREEDWRYTDLSALAARPFGVAPPAVPALAALPGCEALQFVNGRAVGGDLRRSGSVIDAVPSEGVALLNAALSEQGLVWDAEGTPPPLDLLTWFGGTNDGMAHLRHRLRLAPNARVTLILREQGDDASGLATQRFEIELGAGAQLDFLRLQSYGAGTSALTRFDAVLGHDASLRYTSLDSGGALVRHDVNVDLREPGASAEVNGLMLAAGTAHLDMHTRIAHRAPHARSREHFRVIARGRSRAVFNGKVVVHEGAVKTDSEQRVASLLLSPQAQINAKPELEIYNDDVKCAHGATVGQLDETALHYLRTRGVPEAEARRMLLSAFAQEVLAPMQDSPAAPETARLLAGLA